MKPLILYHASCTDGYGAAFAAWCKFGDDAEYVPVQYGDDPLKDIIYEGRDVYMLDFSVPRVDMEHLLDLASKVVWLDHHKTAFEMWCKDGVREKFTQGEVIPKSGAKPVACHIVLDNNKSGALLAWEHFHPHTPVPDLIKRIDDRDRWVFQYPDSKAVHAGLQLMQPWDFLGWSLFVPSTCLQAAGWRHYYDNLVSVGETALKVHAEQIERSVRHAEKCAIRHPDGDHEHNPWEWNSGGYWYAPGLAVNSNVHASEIGHGLANASGTYGLIWYYDGATGRANCSLRSNGDYDVSAIAKLFGGGGHKNAAGFNIDMPTLLGWLA